MTSRSVVMIIVLLLLAGAGGVMEFKKESPKKIVLETIGDMKLTSTAFGDNQLVPAKYTCDAEDINPPLFIEDVPDGTRSLAFILDDPDAPVGDWVHWIMWNIPPETDEIPEDSGALEGVREGMTDFGKPGYGGPCPPSGAHRYHFKLYALDTKLNLSPSATKHDVETAMSGHILDQALLIGLYQRQ